MNCVHAIINIVNYLHECKINVYSKSYFVGKKIREKKQLPEQKKYAEMVMPHIFARQYWKE